MRKLQASTLYWKDFCDVLMILMHILIYYKSLTYYKDPNDPLKRMHLESWYDINLWSQIIDHGLSDIFRMEVVRVDNQETIVRKLCIPGMFPLGLKSQVLPMSSPKGYVTILKRDKLLEVPNTVEEIRNLIKVLASVWKVKKLIMDTMKIVLTPQESYEFYRDLVAQKYPTDEIDVPWSLDSIM
ncbi:hypothetical protein F8M41_025371 [Gigaspora margarita]|uniref:Uncharacterized protein n=1 Tax=Gigaspora margarita TaxID=4874 RepID=A0A8H4AB28_GIGMA|nr:hypothetical protein F8M41_025371 [Gigaspora margarita]